MLCSSGSKIFKRVGSYSTRPFNCPQQLLDEWTSIPPLPLNGRPMASYVGIVRSPVTPRTNVHTSTATTPSNPPGSATPSTLLRAVEKAHDASTYTFAPNAGKFTANTLPTNAKLDLASCLQSPLLSSPLLPFQLPPPLH